MRLVDIDALHLVCSHYNAEAQRIIGEINKAPIIDAVPVKSDEWIPCSERLPKEKLNVLLALKHNMAVGFWEYVSEYGSVEWYVNTGDGFYTGTEGVDNDGTPIAWMPLPDPYKGDE